MSAAGLHGRRASQQVLKAERSGADATGRDAPSTCSPGVGPAGAGQPADAGPAADTHRCAPRECPGNQIECWYRHCDWPDCNSPDYTDGIRNLLTRRAAIAAERRFSGQPLTGFGELS